MISAQIRLLAVIRRKQVLTYLRPFGTFSKAFAGHLQQFVRIMAPWGVFIAAGSILIAAIGFTIDLSDRQSERYLRSWQLVFSVTGVSSSGMNNTKPDLYGRYFLGSSVRPVLEYLNRASPGILCFYFLESIIGNLATDHRRRCIVPEKHRASLAGLDFRGLHLDRIYLPSSRLEVTKFQYARLAEANLEGSNLTNANLRGTDFTNSNLKETILSSAKLDGAKIYGTDLRGANFTEATLEGTMMNCSLKSDNERQTYLVVCTDLRGAEGLSCEQLKKASEWCRSFRDQKLACGASIPEPSKFGFNESNPLDQLSSCPQ